METRVLPATGRILCPHSLGILIEWKLHPHRLLMELAGRPHSLGILIEWKRLTQLSCGMD